MRAGACTVQQTLTSEAASVLRHSLGLARRRGHAQVTPLHVAATLLSSRASLLRRACLKSHSHPNSHPLQCRALELCFNVALNRLPTTPGPLLHGQPSLSNALIAALKRAQAHQRRGCIEQQQQQPLLAIKVELEQLIISILDDPSVSRVMREAGFSSTSVKNNLEDSSASSVFQCYRSSVGVFSSPSSPSHTETHNPNNFWQTHFLNCSSEQNPVIFSTPKKQLSTLVSDSATEKKEDFRLVLEVLLRKKRRNTVVVGDCISTMEGLVTELMGRVERGEVPEELRSAHFIKVHFSSESLRFMKREDVEMKAAELRRRVVSLASGGGAIIYAGDLKWTVEASDGERDGGFTVGEVSGYNPVDHLVAEIGRLLSDYSSSNSKVWLMATANYQTYMRCQLKKPPLDIQWALQAVSLPSSGLGLSLHASSALDSRMTVSHDPSQLLETKPFIIKEELDNLTCCAECTSNFEKEAGIFESSQHKPSSFLLSSCNVKEMDKGSTHLPYWLQPHRTGKHQQDDLVELRRKWNRLCQSLHHPKPDQIQLNSSLFNNQTISSGKNYTYASSYPWWSTRLQSEKSNNFPNLNSFSFTESTSKRNLNSNFVSQFGRSQSCSIEFGFGKGTNEHQTSELSLNSLKNTENKELKITLALGNPLVSEPAISPVQRREKAMDPEDLCRLLQENIPWQSESIHSITDSLLKSKLTKKGTWLLIQGTDWLGKRRLARAMAESLCGSADHLIHMNMRRRENRATQCSEILMGALRSHEKMVFLLEELDCADTQFIKFLSHGFETENFEDPIGREVNISQAIFIMTSSGSISGKHRNEKPNAVIQMKFQLVDQETISNSGLPNLNNKRKSEWDLSNKIKKPRTDEEEGACLMVNDIVTNKQEFSRQLSSNTLDLNIRTEEDDEEGDKLNKPNSVHSDLTQESTMMDRQNPHEFLKSIENRFVFEQNHAQFSQMTKSFLTKLKRSYEEVFGSDGGVDFSVDEAVLEGIVDGSGSFLNNLFEKWLKDVFQTSLETVQKGGKESVRVCLGFNEESVFDMGFMGSNLPKMIKVDIKDKVVSCIKK